MREGHVASGGVGQGWDVAMAEYGVECRDGSVWSGRGGRDGVEAAGYG